MRCHHAVALLAATLLLGSGGFVRAAEPESLASDEQTLKEAGIATDGPSLLEFFRKRTIDATDLEKIKGLIRKLGDESFDVREDASRQLTAMGPIALPLLRKALQDSDIEVVRRAENCLQNIERGVGGSIVASAAHLLAARKPERAAEVLLAYLPFADDEWVAEEVRQALAVVAVHGDKVEPVVTAALDDKSPIKRGAAGAVLARAGIPEQRTAARKLLEDPEPVVRLRVGLALAHTQDKDAVPVLIDLLDKLPAGQVWEVEDLLYRLAEDKAPRLTGSDGAARRKFREDWAHWWKDAGAQVNLARVDEIRTLGYTMVILLDQNKIMELDANNKPRWSIENLQFPLDAQLVGNRVLVAEQGGGRVTERDIKTGEIVWEYKTNEPLVAQRLANGNTFIATRTQLLEVTPERKEVFTYSRPTGDLFMRASKLRNGEIICVTSTNNGTTQFIRMDATGKDLQTFPVDIATFGGRIEGLPNGRVLIPEMHNNRVVEYDDKGKIVWEVPVEQPIVATRLANGHTLVTSMTQLRAIELDRSGKEVWQYRLDTRVTRAWRR